MKNNDLLTPEGTRDLLFDESTARRTVEERLTNIFINHGYSEVITPGIEFYDVFSSKTRYFSQESMYKLTDSKGRLLVIRPDTTMPIARLVSTRLREEKLPLKLFYNQNIFRVNPKNSGRDDEITQSGIEIIGGDEKRSDLEALSIAVEVMKSCDTNDFRLEIGDSAFFKELVSELGIDEYEEIRSLIESKNYPELEKNLSEYANDAARTLFELPKLFGGAEVFDEAEKLFSSEKLKEVLDELKTVYNCLCSLGIGDKLTVDLGMVHNAGYYTGVLFKGYVEEYGMPILSGGRYDTLIGDFGKSTPATGFAVNVNAAANALLRKSDKPLMKKADVLVFSDDKHIVDGIRYVEKLMSEGKIVENAVCNDEKEAAEYAKRKGISVLTVVTDSINTINLD